MRFLFDQNISHRILNLIPADYAESSSVKKEGLMNALDKEIWEFAKRNNYIIVTQNSDFNDLNSLYGSLQKSFGYVREILKPLQLLNC